MKKLLLGLLFALVILVKIDNVSAITYSELPQGARETFEKFVGYLNDGESKIYDVIDSSNSDLKNDIKKYLHNTFMYYDIEFVEKLDNNHYEITASISLHSEVGGSTYDLNGVFTTFEIKLIDGQYKLVDTDLFWMLNEGFSLFFKIVLILFGIIGVVGITITVIAIIVEKKKRKKFQQQYVNNQMIK